MDRSWKSHNTPQCKVFSFFLFFFKPILWFLPSKTAFHRGKANNVKDKRIHEITHVESTMGPISFSR